MNNNKIKNIVFDLGGVIMNLDVPKTINEFKSLGITNIVNDTGHHYKDQVFYDFEIGKVSEIEFIEKLTKISSLNPSTNEIKEAWNAMILDMPQEKINFLIDLKKNYKIFLLSNTNRIHQEKFIAEVNKENNFSFNDLFERAYYSHEIGIRKPERVAFEFVLNDSQLKAKETLFIDDSIDNIKAAKQVGMNVCHITKENLKRKLLNKGIFV